MADQATIEITAQPSKASLLLASVQKTARQIACAVGPSVAYAAPPNFGRTNVVAMAAVFGCFWEIFDFATATVGMGFATAYFPAIAGAGLIGAYLTGWAGWTRSLYLMLKCIRQQ